MDARRATGSPIAESLRAAGVPAARGRATRRTASTTTRPPASGACGRPSHHREMGDVRVDGIPVHLSETDWAIERGGPCLGEHNDQVFARAARPRRRRDRPARATDGVDREPDMPRAARRAAGRRAGVSEHAAFAGKMLGDLGADVIVVEPPGGHAQPRRTARSSTTSTDPERSLWWWHYNTSKRGVVLDLDDRRRRRAVPRPRGRRRHRARGRAAGRAGRRSALDHADLRAAQPTS